MARLRLVAITRVAFAALALGLTDCRRSHKSEGEVVGSLKGHNLLIITLDTTRADRLGCYGYAKAQTPTLDALAKKGTLFENASAQVPLTLPSHCSIFTGRYPKEHGVRVNGHNSLPEGTETLATLLKRQGYQTGATIAAFVLHSVFGLHRGFDSYNDDVASSGGDAWSLTAERRADTVTDAALKWLELPRQDPFFAWVHYFDPHDPYDPPEPFRGKFVQPYDGEIAFMDSQIKRIVDWLEQSGHAAKTLLIVAGDHGESFSEHIEHGHGVFLYRTAIHVPLLVVHPKEIPAGVRVSTAVDLIDLLPTVVELLGLADTVQMSGRSLAGVFRGEALDPRPSYSESHYAHYSFGWAQQRSLTTDRWKYISSTEPELYDAAADPNETRDLIRLSPDVARTMREAIEQMFGAMTGTDAPEAALDEEARRRLSALGYVAEGSMKGSDDFLTKDLPDPKRNYDVVLLTIRADDHMDAGRPEEALALLEEAVRKAPEAFQIKEKMSRCLERLNRRDEAILAIQSMLQANPRHLSSLLRMGNLLLDAGRTGPAIEHLQAALAIEESNARTHAHLAKALHREKRWDEAIAHARRSLELSPSYSVIHIELGAILAEKGNVAEAVAVFQKAAELEACRYEANYNLGLLALRRERPEEAEHYFAEALRIAPADARAMGQLTKLFLQQRRIGDMVRVLRDAAAAEPNNVRFAFSLAQILATSRDATVRNGQEAIRWATRAAELTDHGDPEVLAMLAAAYAEAGEFSRAIEVGKAALSKAQLNSDDRLAGRIRLQLTEFEQGKAVRDPSL